ncbi:hypothetical protein C8J56DRAFT_895369 [Mycena floridula]|nr:hypothetical protein C8J56DRAFT_895369 [Mycena floridula]
MPSFVGYCLIGLTLFDDGPGGTMQSERDSFWFACLADIPALPLPLIRLKGSLSFEVTVTLEHAYSRPYLYYCFWIGNMIFLLAFSFAAPEPEPEPSHYIIVLRYRLIPLILPSFISRHLRFTRGRGQGLEAWTLTPTSQTLTLGGVYLTLPWGFKGNMGMETGDLEQEEMSEEPQNVVDMA